MQKKLFRILSVFLIVVIVSVMFMQPIAYANAAVVGGGLVLLVAGLLIVRRHKKRDILIERLEAIEKGLNDLSGKL